LLWSLSPLVGTLWFALTIPLGLSACTYPN